MISRVFLIASLLSLFALDTQGQYGQHKWRKAKFSVDIPEKWQGEDAVILTRRETVSNHVDPNKTSSLRTVFLRIQLLTQDGVDNYAKIYLRKADSERILKLDARTRKSNGKWVDLDEEDIYQLKYKDPFLSESRYTEIRFAVPGAEVGDVIEIIYSLKKNHLNFGEDVYLHSYLPCLKSRFTYRCPNELVSELIYYNDMPQPKVEKGQTLTSMVFDLENLEDNGNGAFGIPSLQLPYLSFAVRMFQYPSGRTVPINTNNWEKVHEVWMGSGLSTRTGGGFNNAYATFRDSIYTASGNDGARAMENLVVALNQSFNWRYLDESESGRPVSWIIEQRAMNRDLFKKIVEDCFAYWEVPYAVRFVRDKYSGPFDMNFVSLHMVDAVVYTFKGSNGKTRSIFPSSIWTKYYVNELPFPYKGTDGVSMSKRHNSAASSAISVVENGTNDPKDNTLLAQADMEVDLETGHARSTMHLTLAGDPSTLFRDALAVQLRGHASDLYGIQVDTVLSFDSSQQSVVFPFDFDAHFEFETSIPIIAVADSLYSMTFTDLYDFLQFEVDADDRALDVFFPFAYEDRCEFQMNFDRPVELVQPIDAQISNALGAVGVSTTTDSTGSLVFSAYFRIEKNFCPAQELQLLTELNRGLSDALGKSVVVKGVGHSKK